MEWPASPARAQRRKRGESEMQKEVIHMDYPARYRQICVPIGKLPARQRNGVERRCTGGVQREALPVEANRLRRERRRLA